MAESPDYKELLQLLNESDVDYLIVGGFAVMKYGEPRYTKDFDIWVRNSTANALRRLKRLRDLELPPSTTGSRLQLSPTNKLSIKSGLLQYGLTS